MSEEKGNLQRRADRARAGSKRSVVSYLAVLFGAAFLLLLLSYFMQQRVSQEAISGLKDSVNAFESIEQLLDDNQALREEADALREQNEALHDQVVDVQVRLTQTQKDLKQAQDALAQFQPDGTP